MRKCFLCGETDIQTSLLKHLVECPKVPEVTKEAAPVFDHEHSEEINTPE